MKIKISIAQLNPTVGAISENLDKALECIKEAKRNSVDILVFPEMYMTGYPPNDLLLRKEFVDAVSDACFKSIYRAKDILNETKDICVIMGSVGDFGGHLRNCAYVFQNKKLMGVAIKSLLPEYDVFFERRYFKSSEADDIAPVCVKIRGHKIALGVEICEDLWYTPEEYNINVTELLCKRGADIIINVSASPFYANKLPVRIDLVKDYVKQFKIPFVYANLIGGQDDLVFDGGSFIMDAKGSMALAAPQFEESILSTVLETGKWCRTDKNQAHKKLCKEEQIFQAQVLNVRDYVDKSKFFKGIIIGSSGGIDSAYALCVAEKAVGADKVLSVAMPSKFTSNDSLVLAEQLAINLGIEHVVVPINKIHDAAWEVYEEIFGTTEFGIAEENDQARCRMMILMKLSHKRNLLVCSTGNKSELSVGYYTLYGDSAGGKNIPGDLYKTEIYDISKYINRSKEVIPWGIINRPPTAELKSNQKDTDSLPSYDVLDKILYYLESDDMRNLFDMAKPHGVERIGFDVVDKVLRLYKNSEFKRDQLCKGIKVSEKAFGIGRRIPITSGWEYKCPRR